jgi:hypothetical protein
MRTRSHFTFDGVVYVPDPEVKIVCVGPEKPEIPAVPSIVIVILVP